MIDRQKEGKMSLFKRADESLAQGGFVRLKHLRGQLVVLMSTGEKTSQVPDQENPGQIKDVVSKVVDIVTTTAGSTREKGKEISWSAGQLHKGVYISNVAVKRQLESTPNIIGYVEADGNALYLTQQGMSEDDFNSASEMASRVLEEAPTTVETTTEAPAATAGVQPPW